MLSLEDQFWYMINERHYIFLKKQAGKPKPWTNDPIMRQYKFTNVFRELDRTTIFVRENIREPLWDDPELLLFNIALFRQTGAVEGWQGIVRRWDAEKQAAKYVAAQERGTKVFTGAYMVPGMFPGAKGNNKVVSLFKYVLQPVWENRRRLVALCRETRSMEALTGALGEFMGWKGNRFMAYEVACDLLYTPLLEGAVDQYTWANPGPGAQRGLSRLYGGEINMGRGAGSRDRDTCIKEMKELLRKAPKKLGAHIMNFGMDVDMRFCENALCEYDKYQRTQLGQGRPRSKYNGT
jgi:hypothetical protein